MKTYSKARLWLLFLAIFLMNATRGWAQNKKPWKVKDSFRAKRISSLRMAPNGDQLLFVVSRTVLSENARFSSLWKWSKADGKAMRLTSENGSVSSPRWSPDGSRIAYFKADESGLGLWVMNRDGSDAHKLTNLEQSNADLYHSWSTNKLSWSPDGKRLAYTAAGKKHFKNDINPPFLPTGNDVMIIDRMLYKTFYFYSDQRRTHVFTISADGGQPKKISTGDFDYYSISWSPDGRYIACVSNQTGHDDRNANNDIMLLPADGGQKIQLTHSVGPESNVRWNSNGKELAYLARQRAGRSKETDAELVKLFTLPVSNDTLVHSNTKNNITGPLDRWANKYKWANDNLYFTIQDKGRVELYKSSDDGSNATSIIDDQGQVGDFAVAGDGTVYYVYGDFTHPDEIYRVNTDGSGKVKLTSFNQDFINQVSINDARHFRFKSFDGLPIDGWIMKPDNYQKGKKYPLILNIHGGPHGQYGYRLSGKFQEEAANGYVVLFLNPRGSSGRGQAFSDKVVADLGGDDYRDIMFGLDYAIGRFKYIDSDRMGVGGVSYGGYMTNWIITHTNRFKAAVSVSGISDLITQWSGGNLFLWYESDMGGIKPYENYELAWDRSPLKYVVGATTPTLFVHGRWDNDVPMKQAISMYMALKSMGVDTKVALYPHEGHGVRNQPKHTADYHRRALNWYDKYLK